MANATTISYFPATYTHWDDNNFSNTATECPQRSAGGDFFARFFAEKTFTEAQIIENDGYALSFIDGINPDTLAIKHFQDRIAELKKLRKGWYDNKLGEPLNGVALDMIASLFAANYTAFNLKGPYVYPTLDSSIQLEWDVKRWRISLEIDLGTLKGEFYALELDSDEEVIKDDLDMNRPQDWQWVSKWLQAKQAEIGG